MEVNNNPTHDPVADLPLVDIFLHWTLVAAEEVLGRSAMAIVLRQAGLDSLIENYPPDEIAIECELTYRDCATVNAVLLNFYGPAARGLIERTGRRAAQLAVAHESCLFALDITQDIDNPALVKRALEQINSGMVRLADATKVEWSGQIEGHVGTLRYSLPTCPVCAGKQADDPVCWFFTAFLAEILFVLTAKPVEIHEVECRATGSPQCIWEIHEIS